MHGSDTMDTDASFDFMHGHNNGSRSGHEARAHGLDTWTGLLVVQLQYNSSTHMQSPFLSTFLVARRDVETTSDSVWHCGQEGQVLFR